MSEHYTIPKDSALEAILKVAKWESDLILIAYELGRSAKERLRN
jgi:hypothetical protein